MNRYELVSHWHIDAPVHAVWGALWDVPNWPRWWSYVLEVEEIAHGGPDGIGAVHRLTWGTTFPYLLSFTMRRSVVQPLQMIETLFEGEINGIGRWTLKPHGTGTEVQHDWEVSTAGTWMNVMSPLLGPMFRWNHGLVMAHGAQGLARYLSGR